MEVFGSGGGQAVADSLSRALGAPVPLLGQVPLETRLRECGDGGTPIVLAEPDSPAATALRRDRRPPRRPGPRPGRAQPEHHAGMTDPADLDAVELLAAYRDRELSPVEATSGGAGPHRASSTRGSTRSASSTRPRRSTAARASEDRWARGEPCGRARRRAGVDQGPAAHPRLADAARLALDRPRRARGTSTRPSVARVREQGGVLVGKTTTPEFGWKGVTDSAAAPASPATRGTRRARPAAPRAAARRRVALGMGPLSLGTDGGGSVRIPAAFCGIPRSSRPTGGCRSTRRARSARSSHVGPMTRTVADAALLLDVMSGADAARRLGAGPGRARPSRGARRAGRGPAGRGERRRSGYVDVDPGVAAAFAAAVDVLVDAGGARRGGRPGLRRPGRGVRDAVVLRRRGVARGRCAAHVQAGMDPGWWTWRPQGARIGAVDYLDARWPCAASWACGWARSTSATTCCHPDAADHGVRGRASRCRRGGRASAGRRGRRSPTRST